MNELLEALHNLLSFAVEDARAHNLDKNHVPVDDFQHVRADMAKLAYSLGVYLDKHT